MYLYYKKRIHFIFPIYLVVSHYRDRNPQKIKNKIHPFHFLILLLKLKIIIIKFKILFILFYIVLLQDVIFYLLFRFSSILISRVSLSYYYLLLFILSILLLY